MVIFSSGIFTDYREKPCKIIHRKLREADIDSLTTTDTMRVRKNIYHARSSMIRKLPYKVTNLDEIFLLINNSEKNIVAFFYTN